MNLTNAMDPFASTFLAINKGLSFKGQLLAVPMEESSTYFINPRRILKLYPKSPAKAGDYILEKNSGKRFLAAENGPSLWGDKIIHTTLKLFEVTHPNASIDGRETIDDEVTGLKKTVDRPNRTIPVVIEFTKTQEDEMRIGADLVRIISATPISPNDKIEGYSVVNVEKQIGLYFATARNMYGKPAV